jgi:hypothetical protein
MTLVGVLTDPVIATKRTASPRSRRPDEKCGLGLSDATIQAAVCDSLTDLAPPVAPADAFSAIGDALATAAGKRLWVEKTPHHLVHLSRIMEHAPGSRMVVMLRDPEAFMLPYKHQGDRKPEGSREVFQQTYHPVAVALVCRGYLRAAKAAARRFPGDVRIVWLDDLRAAPADGLRAILDHLRLPAVTLKSLAESNSTFPAAGDAKPTLTADDKLWLRILVRAPAATHNRRVPEAGFAPMVALASVGRLPIWAASLVSTHRHTGVSVWRLARRWIR